MPLTKEQLLKILVYDSEECRILTLTERCLIRKERARQEQEFTPQEFENEKLQELISKTLQELKQAKWVCPEIEYRKDENGNIEKVNKNELIS